ncbi:MAG: uL15 family ribosomal protein [Candidatus Puniceispirillum sp.]
MLRAVKKWAALVLCLMAGGTLASEPVKIGLITALSGQSAQAGESITRGLQVAIDAGRLDAGKPVDSAALLAAGVISKPRDGVRILAKGELTAKKVEIHAAGASKAAVAAVEKAGGKIVVPAAAAE